MQDVLKLQNIAKTVSANQRNRNPWFVQLKSQRNARQ